MPDDEALDYLPTQAVADFLATEAGAPLDGIFVPSVQSARDVLNVVLFHKAARVQALDTPDGTEMRASTGHMGEDGWETDYSVIEEVPPQKTAAESGQRGASLFDFASFIRPAPSDQYNYDDREPALRIITDSIEVHIVRRVQFETEAHVVTRHRWEKNDKIPF